MDRAHHPALLLVDVVSSLASIDFKRTTGAWTWRSPARKRV